jgi:hypothetical protein
MEPSYPHRDCNKPKLRKQRLQNFPYSAVTLGILIPCFAGPMLQLPPFAATYPRAWLHPRKSLPHTTGKAGTLCLRRDRRFSDSIGRLRALDIFLWYPGHQSPQPFARFFDGMLFSLLEKPLVVRQTRGVFCDPAFGEFSALDVL